MATYNKVILMGNLTRDPELKHTPKGTAAAQIGMAVNRKWRDESGAEKEEVTFLDVQAWGKQAEVIAQYCKKGSALLVEGRLKLDEWEDKTTGKKVQKLRVVMESFQFVGAPRQDGQTRPAATRPAANNDSRPSAAPLPSTAEQDDDVPF